MMQIAFLSLMARAAAQAAKTNSEMMCRGWLYQPKTPQSLLKAK